MSVWLLRLLGALLVLSAVALALSRAPDRSVESLVARWAPPPSDFVEVNGMVVHVRDQGPRGDPLPIVLIHGTSASLHTWEGWVKSLTGERRVVTFDLPGFGLTGPFGGSYAPDDYRGAAYARFVVDLLDRLRLPRVVLGGNSLGGEVAWRTALLAPERVAALVLVDASGPRFVPEAVPLGFAIARVPLVNRLSEWVLPRGVVAQSVASVYGNPAKVTPALVDRYFELALRAGNRRALAQRIAVVVQGEDASGIEHIRQPTLIVWGGRDRLIPPATAQAFERAIPGSRLVVLPGLGHVPQEEDAALSVQPVRAFLGLR
ncbi:MAG: alpha/beta hydrolase [Pseudomonadota bacterium]|nr:alpha/beta hydrolase [Rubrivivax sp.]